MGFDRPLAVFTDSEPCVPVQVLRREHPLWGDTTFPCLGLGSGWSRDFNKLGHSVAPGAWRYPTSSSGAPDLCGGPRPAVPTVRPDLFNAFHRRRVPSGNLHRGADRAGQRGPRPPCLPRG
ncbi:hypothetical protein NDU88_003156 [Pleurodeles waltl]|uniref:Uncharacterized protein n=1 Tax=Pleurodeles waltl TaxID=8319 RepID=A0AAV7NHF4_PLEWA|nr:hypothetical protein NDU88_003156 [Pleurodeles waltl]